MRVKLFRWVLAAWILAGLAALGQVDPAASTHADAFTAKGLLKADFADLKDTTVAVQPDVPLDPNQNVLWCGTLQLAWNQAIDLVGEKLRFVSQPPEVDRLNRETFTRADLDPASYVALADFERNHVEDEIRATLARTFHGAASPELIPPTPKNPSPNDFVAYAYLFKNLAFAHPFAENSPLDFGGRPVENFGFAAHAPHRDDVLSQVLPYSYRSGDDFILQLRTKAADDELIFAKVTPQATLAATIQAVLKRMDAGPESWTPGPGDTLAVPKLNLDLRGHFPKLENLVLQPGPAAKVRALVTSSVQQLIRFQLDEKGAVLKSEASMVMTATAMPLHVFTITHPMIFNQPFLILMKRASSAQPYFALWVGNPSLLIPASGAPGP